MAEALGHLQLEETSSGMEGLLSSYLCFLNSLIENSAPGRLKFSKIYEFWDIFKIQ